MNRQRCAEKTNSICSPLRQRRCQRYRIGPETRHHTQWPEEESLSLCSLFLFVFFAPRKAGDKAVAVRGSKGRVPGLETHTHTKRLHQYYKPQRQERVCVFAQKSHSQCKRMLFILKNKSDFFSVCTVSVHMQMFSDMIQHHGQHFKMVAKVFALICIIRPLHLSPLPLSM